MRQAATQAFEGDVPALFGHPVRNEARLREIIPAPFKITMEKTLDFLDRHCKTYITLCPYVVVATADGSGTCDASPRGGPAGFVKVLDDRHILLPEVTGNRRADSLLNLLQNGRVGMMFIIPGLEEILRINGRAWIVQDTEILTKAVVMEKTPLLGIGVRVEEAYIHCAKAAKRSSLWHPDGWPARHSLAPPAEIIRDHTRGGVGDGSVAAVQQILDESYTNRLY